MDSTTTRLNILPTVPTCWPVTLAAILLLVLIAFFNRRRAR
jgi:hypothetical protein